MSNETNKHSVLTMSPVDFEARKLIATGMLLVAGLAMLFAGQRWTQERSSLAAEQAVDVQYASLADEYAAWRAEKEAAAAQPKPVTFTSVRHAISDLVEIDYSLIEVADIRADERRCLAEAIYYESAYEPAIGQMAVADVILNRVESSVYPDSICGVVYQGSHRVTGCQFSFTCDGSLERRRNKTAYANAERMAGAILAGMHLPVSKNATHYHADYVSPYWAPKLVPTADIGTHKFYKYPNKTTITAAAQ